ncbi:MAG: hypothetical protein U0531_16935 [Dehalococcoidia bacterium]
MNLSSSGGSTLLGTNFNNLAVSETTVTGSSCTAAVNLDQGSGTAAITASFISVSASNCTNGIVLRDTVGSFAVTGSSSGICGGQVTVNAVGTPATVSAPNIADCTGGTIQSSSGNGIILNNVQNVSLTRMYLLNNGLDTIIANVINGFTLDHSYISDNSGIAQDRGIEIGDFSTGTSVNGSINITNSTIGPTPHDSIAMGVSSGTSTWNITGTQFNSTGNSGLNTELRGTAVFASFTVDGCVFSGAGPTTSARGTFVNNLDDSVIGIYTIQNSTFINNNIAIDVNQQNDTDPVGSHTFEVMNNTILSSNSHAVNIFAAAGSFGGTFTGRFEGNVIGNAGTVGSGSAIGNGVRVNINGGSDATVVLHNNTIRQTPNGRGIEVIARNGAGGLDITITNNNVDPQATVAPLSAILVQSNCLTICNTLRSDIRGNTVPSGNTATDLLTTYIALVESSTSTLELVDTPPANADCTAQLTSTNTGSASASAGCALIAGPINVAFAPGRFSGPGAASSRTSAFVLPSDMAFASVPLVARAKTTTPEAAAAAASAMPQSLTYSAGSGWHAVGLAARSALAGETVTVNGTGGGFTLPAGESTTITFDATIGAGFTGTTMPNQASVTATGGISVTSNLLQTPVIQPPTITKAFSPTSIVAGGTATLTFTLTNPNPSQSLSQVSFSDAFPPGLQVHTTPGVVNTCGGTFSAPAAATTVSLSGGSIAAGLTCTVAVTVTGAAEGDLLNTPGHPAAPDSLESDAGVAGPTATLRVINPPTIAKGFAPATIAVGGTSALTITVTNGSAAFGLTGAGFSDALPAGVQVAATPIWPPPAPARPPPPPPRLSASAARRSRPAGRVRSASTSPPPPSGTRTTRSASLPPRRTAPRRHGPAGVFGPPAVTKSWPHEHRPERHEHAHHHPHQPGSQSRRPHRHQYQRQPAGRAGGSGHAGATNSCGGTFAPAAGNTSLSLSGGAIGAAGGSCAVSVAVTGTTAGAKANTTGNVSSTEGGTGLTASATLNVFAPPTVTKSQPDRHRGEWHEHPDAHPHQPGGQPWRAHRRRPAGHLPRRAGGGQPAQPDHHQLRRLHRHRPGERRLRGGDVGIKVSNATAVTATCVVTMQVTAASAGSFVNTTDAVTSTNGGTGATATATLTVATPPTIGKAFSPTQIPVGGSSTLTFTITNPNAGLA